jgi:tetratricopeptide (TPR) repeat protein
VGLASALEAAGNVAEAEAELGRAITELQGRGGLRERLADVLLRQGKNEPALVQLEAEGAANPANRAVRVRVARLALQLGRADQAVKVAQAVVLEDPATPEALFTLGRAREALGDLGAALQDYKRATAIGTSSDLHLVYGQALSRAGREDDALGQLTAAGERPLARLERGRIHLRRGEVTEALQHAEGATRLEPTLADAHFLRGQCLDLMGNAEDAAGAWKAALRVDPKLAEAHYRLGRHEMDKGRPAVALGYFRQAAALRPEKVAWLADLLFQLGFAEAQGGSRGNAALALKRYLEVAPRDAPARPEAERELARVARR